MNFLFPQYLVVEFIGAAGDLSRFDAAVVVTDHSAVDYRRILDRLPIVVDTRGVYREPSAKVVKA